MKKTVIILLLFVAILTGGYLYIRFVFLKTRDFKPNTSNARSVLDLRPALIAKLQQLVKDGSNGLYILSIGKLDPDILSSKLDVINGSIYTDTVAFHQLDHLQKLPDDIFNIRFDSLHIEGIGIEDLLNKKQVDVKGIRLSHPVIEVYHIKRSYNKLQRLENDSMSVYQRLTKQLDKIAIGKIDIQHGTLIDHDLASKGKVTKFNNITIRLDDLLIDSTTQHDKSRFLFAKQATLEMKDYCLKTPDSLYLLKAASISISGEQHKMTLLNVELKPRENRQEFESRLKERSEMFRVIIPKITLSDIRWWAMIHREEFISSDADMFGGVIDVYLDKSLPPGVSIKLPNFPDQFLMKIPFPVLVKKINLYHFKLVYEEFNPTVHRSGMVTFQDINGGITNVSNIPAEIKTHPFADFSATCLFMNKVPMTGKFRSDLPKYRTGDFTAEIHMGALDSGIINTITEPLGLIRIKSGQMQQADAHLDGNNLNAKGTISMYYNDLHITPLKKDSTESGKLKKKSFTSFIGNTFLIKNSNPSKNGDTPRQPGFIAERGHRNFFNFVWVSILTGILKTIGIPVKLVLN